MSKIPYVPADHSEMLAGILKENHLSGAEAAPRLSEFVNRLLTVNQVMNLTAIVEPEAVGLKHIADSLALLSHIPNGEGSLIDVGAGPGLPSAPLAIASPDLRVTAIDSTAKRIAFVNSCAEEMPIPNLRGVCGRAEDLGRECDFREKFDFATARAVASLSVLTELCMPFVRLGGYFLAMKSGEGEEESKEASRAIQALGGKLVRIHNYSLTSKSETLQRSILVIQKIHPTPSAYPRPYAKIVKKPL